MHDFRNTGYAWKSESRIDNRSLGSVKLSKDPWPHLKGLCGVCTSQLAASTDPPQGQGASRVTREGCVQLSFSIQVKFGTPCLGNGATQRWPESSHIN